MSILPDHEPTCDLCGHRGKGVRFVPEEGVWLCKNSRACTRRFNIARAEAEQESARWELMDYPDEDDLPF